MAQHDRLSASLEINVRMPKAEVLQTALCRCATWSPNANPYDKLRTEHHRLLPHGIGFRRERDSYYRVVSYRDTLTMMAK